MVNTLSGIIFILESLVGFAAVQHCSVPLPGAVLAAAARGSDWLSISSLLCERRSSRVLGAAWKAMEAEVAETITRLGSVAVTQTQQHRRFN